MTTPRITRELIDLTPKMAADLLASNTMNRTLNQSRVKRIKASIDSGEWRLNGQPIIVSDNGVLLDGQHRCAAVEMAGVAVKTLIVYGISEEAFATIDCGKSRTASDVLSSKRIANPKRVASVLRLIWQNTLGVLGSSDAQHQPTNFDIEELADESVEDVQEAIRVCAKGKHTTSAPVFFMYWLTMKENKKMATPFWEAVHTGVGLTKGSPALKLRDTLFYNLNSKAKHRPFDILEFCVRAWVCYLAGHEVQILRPGVLSHRGVRNDKDEIVVPMSSAAALRVTTDSMRAMGGRSSDKAKAS